MRRYIVIALIIILTLANSIPTIYSQTEFRVVDFTGEWDLMEKDHIKSKASRGYTYIVLEEANVVLGSWFTTIDLTLTGQHGDKIQGAYIIEIPEMNLTLKYIEEYSPGSFFDFGYSRKNTLTITIGDKPVYTSMEEANWPFDTRLNTRIYFGIWRVDKDNLAIQITDYYGEINSNRSVYWFTKIEYHGETLTLRLKLEKKSSVDSTIEAYLYYNEVERDKIVGGEVEVRLLSIDSAALFYASLGFLIIAIIANFTSRTWKYYEEKRSPHPKTKKDKPSSRGK